MVIFRLNSLSLGFILIPVVILDSLFSYVIAAHDISDDIIAAQLRNSWQLRRREEVTAACGKTA